MSRVPVPIRVSVAVLGLEAIACGAFTIKALGYAVQSNSDRNQSDFADLGVFLGLIAAAAGALTMIVFALLAWRMLRGSPIARWATIALHIVPVFMFGVAGRVGAPIVYGFLGAGVVLTVLLFDPSANRFIGRRPAGQ